MILQAGTEKKDLIEGINNPTTAVEEHCIRAEAIPKGVVDCIQERMPV
jgi:hypothetical protein